MKQIKYLAVKAGVSLKEVAEHLGVSTNTVYSWSSGKRVPRASMLPKLAEILDCDYNELLGA